MPTWVYGIGMAILLILRPRIFGWAFGFLWREIRSLWNVSAEEQLQRDAAAHREAMARADDEPPTGAGGVSDRP